jgi:hypothetical protein
MIRRSILYACVHIKSQGENYHQLGALDKSPIRLFDMPMWVADANGHKTGMIFFSFKFLLIFHDESDERDQSKILSSLIWSLMAFAIHTTHYRVKIIKK